jgi:D-arabinose 1-dehydrogenase-like Zn-dependent alcohol dehydrogenase
MSLDTALFAGDVMGTGFHAVAASGMRPGDVVAVLGLGPVGLCAVQVARACGAAARDRDRHRSQSGWRSPGAWAPRPST